MDSFIWGSPRGCRIPGVSSMATRAMRWELTGGLLYLYPSFWEVDPGCQLVADMDIGVVGEVEELLQLLQLLCGEGGSDPPLALLLLWMEEGPS